MSTLITINPKEAMNGRVERSGPDAPRAALSHERGVRARLPRSGVVLMVLLVALSALAPTRISVNAAPIGTHFDHIVIIAMENQNYGSVIGNTAAPFINSLAALGTTIPHYHSYGAGAFGGDTISGCSAACYTALVSGSTGGIGDGYGCCLAGQTIVNQLATAGLTWQAYCAQSCPRGNDHFPFTGFSATNGSPNIFTSSSVTTSTFIAAANSATPANFLWYTPTDSQNMHDNSVSSGDAYLQQFLVGSGSVNSPASGSLLASNLFRNANFHTFLYLWWDEYDPSPNVEFGYNNLVKAGFTSPASYDEYSSLGMIEDNWGLPRLGFASAATPINDVFGTVGAQIGVSFTYSPLVPVVGQAVTFTATVSGGTPPYSFTWTGLSQGSTGTGNPVSTTYTTAGSKTVTVTVTGQGAQTASSSATIVVGSTGGTGALSFGSCNPLPVGWNCGNYNGLTGGSSTIVGGVYQANLLATGTGNDNDYQWATTQKGVFPWTPCTAPVPGVFLANQSSIVMSFTPKILPTGSQQIPYRYHVYVAMYYWLPAGPVTLAGHTYQCLDTQSRVENINGVFSTVGTTETYDPGDSFGWNNVTFGPIAVGQQYTLTADVASNCIHDLQAWGMASATAQSCQLSGVEIGVEGFQFNQLAVDFTSYQLSTGQVAPSGGGTSWINLFFGSPAVLIGLGLLGVVGVAIVAGGRRKH